ncbi:hypothetical protein [Ruegeria arenilitoris]|uniref:hypothetical protein n=1 Tax=Ruegeria arenilitoris TaxID=1173585 RepID=UPI00147FBCC1|nr:hypothetical protein [Ruegeria arenilitoris]
MTASNMHRPPDGVIDLAQERYQQTFLVWFSGGFLGSEIISQKVHEGSASVAQLVVIYNPA